MKKILWVLLIPLLLLAQYRGGGYRGGTTISDKYVHTDTLFWQSADLTKNWIWKNNDYLYIGGDDALYSLKSFYLYNHIVGTSNTAEIQWDGPKWFIDYDSNATDAMLIWGLVDTLNYNKANSVLKWSDDFNVEDTLSVDIVVPSDSGGITFGDSVNFVDNLVGSGEGKYIHWDGDELLLGCDKIGSSQIIGFSLKDSAIYDTVTKRLSFTGKLEVEDTLFTDIIMPNDSTSLIIGSSGGLAADSITSNNWIKATTLFKGDTAANILLDAGRFFATDPSEADSIEIRSDATIGVIDSDNPLYLRVAGANKLIASTYYIEIVQALKQTVVTIDDGDATPSVNGGNIFVTSSNTGATEITDLDNPIAGQVIYLIGGSNTNSSTIADGGNFNLSAGWTANVDDVLILLVQADNDYIELGRVDN